MKARTFSITINGDRWKYQVVSEESFVKQVGEAAVAATNPKKRLMLFKRDQLTFGPVFHELFHAYCHYLYLNSSSISFEDYEEIIAEMLEEKVHKIVEQANKMLAKMTGGQDGKDRKGTLGGTPREAEPREEVGTAKP